MMSSSSSRVRTVPTGFQGVLSKMTSVPVTHAVLELSASERESAVAERRGDGRRTAAPKSDRRGDRRHKSDRAAGRSRRGRTRAPRAAQTPSVAPSVIRISRSGSYESPCSRWSFSATALRRAGSPWLSG